MSKASLRRSLTLIRKDGALTVCDIVGDVLVGDEIVAAIDCKAYR